MSRTIIAGAMVRGGGQGRPYSLSERAQALEYAARRRREGAGLLRIARELGIARGTLVKWIAMPTFDIVKVADVAARSVHATVHGPRGLRIEGLSVAEIVELIRSLA